MSFQNRDSSAKAAEHLETAADLAHETKEKLKGKWDSAVLGAHEMLHDSDSEDEEGRGEGGSYVECDCADHDQHKQAQQRLHIPYVCIYEEADACEERGYLMPGYPIRATIVNMERDASSAMNLFNPYLYTIEFEHGPYRWQVQRRYKDFTHLHTRMLMHRAAEKMKQPVRAIERSLFYDDNELAKSGTMQATTGDTGNHGFNDTTSSAADQLDYTAGSGLTGEQLDASTSAANGSAANTTSATTHKCDNPDGTCSSGLAHGPTEPGGRPHRHKLCKLPDFPRWPESAIGTADADVRKEALEKYLQGLLHIAGYRNHKETAEFMEVSRMSFVHNLGAKYHEAQVKKRPGGRRTFHGWKRFCIEYCARWSRRHLFIKDSFVGYMRHGELRCVMLIDGDFKVMASAASNEGIAKGLSIINRQRLLQLACYTDREVQLWKDEIDRTAVRGPGALWTKPQRFGSTYPPRDNSWANWFSDGETFMSHAANMMEMAQEEIFITDWWLSPEIYMKRPMQEGNRWRLDEILKRKAEQGIQIFVMLYKEIEMALGINSMYSKRMLQIHPNIHVLRHPEHMPGTGTFLWAHHEKLICVDQNIAFVGGIDLCYGRWDNAEHKLTDGGSISLVQQQEAHPTLMSGMKAFAKAVPILAMNSQDDGEEDAEVAQANANASNDSGVDEVDAQPGSVPQNEHDNDDSRSIPAVSFNESRLKNQSTDSDPVKGVAASRSKKGRFRALADRVTKDTRANQSADHQPDDAADRFDRLAQKLNAPGAGDDGTDGGEKQKNFAQLVKEYTSAVKEGKVEAEKQRAVTPPLEKKAGKLKAVVNKFRSHKPKAKFQMVEDDEKMFGKGYELKWLKLLASQPDDEGLRGQGKLWIGKDYVNFIFKDFTDLDLPFHDFIDRSRTPRMPWHDIHSVVYGAAARDVARHFVERWNACKVEKAKSDPDYPFLMPKSYENTEVPRVFRSMSHACQVQVLRSACTWSAGINGYEDSIQMGYLSMIANSQHYIYIENQFFVSLINHPEVRNEICKALCDRIERAYKEQQRFRVYIMIPLMPGFEGQLGATGGSALQAVMHWNARSISDGPYSLYHNLQKRGVDNPCEYVHFGGLRTYDILAGRLVTELIYIHSKLMIVDDKWTIIGSANINDRSQAGKRDSEVCVYVHDSEFTDGTMGGQPFKSGSFGGSMRRYLMQEHLGLLKDQQENKLEGMGVPARPNPNYDVHDITCDAFWHDVWRKTAQTNTDVYEQVFRCIPTDSVTSLEQLQSYQEALPLADYNAMAAKDQLATVQGHLVNFPDKFLIDSDLSPAITTKEGMAPVSLFT